MRPGLIYRQAQAAADLDRRSGGGSRRHSPSSIAPIATTPHRHAGSTRFTVRSRKKAAVNHAATIGGQPGRGMRISHCGAASIGLDTIVSRPPVGAFGR